MLEFAVMIQNLDTQYYSEISEIQTFRFLVHIQVASHLKSGQKLFSILISEEGTGCLNSGHSKFRLVQKPGVIWPIGCVKKCLKSEL